MKILHAVLSPLFYGSERYCVDLAIGQAQDDNDVVIVTFDAYSDCTREFRAVLSGSDSEWQKRIRIVAIPRWLPSWLHRPFALALLLNLRPDLVHTHLNPAARRIGSCAQVLGIPHVMTLHLDYDPHEHAGFDGLIALSETQRRQIAPAYPGKVAIVWNWLSGAVRSDPVGAAADAIDLRRSWGAGGETVVFGSVGRLKPEKGMDWLIRAFRSAFPDDIPNVRLVIVGGGAQRAALEQLVDGDPRIVLAGHQSSMAAYYQAFDVFVSAARFEPFGLAIIEAMASGCRLIVTRIYGTLEFVSDPSVRWVVPDDEAELVVQLRTAVSCNRNRVTYDMRPFDRGRAVREIDVLYRDVLMGRRLGL
jgi:glycosyltransferase involved in cell wall biosynthesis